jgi:hypothetical protein
MRAQGLVSAIAAIFFAGLLAGAAVPRSALAQNDYPNRPLSLIVPYAAGGVADVAMRMPGDKLSTRLGQQFVIENRPGAGGIVAAQAAASALGGLRSGRRLHVVDDRKQHGDRCGIVQIAALQRTDGFRLDFHRRIFDLLVVTRAGSPLHSVKDVIAAARANPGKLNIGTINPGSTQNLAAELFTSTAEIKAAIVPFRTSPDMAGALLRGDIDVAFEFYAAVHGLLADNKLVALERAIRSGGDADADYRDAQSRHERGDAVSRHANAVGGNGHGHALEHTGRNDGPDESRYEQMVRCYRKSRDRQTRLRRRGPLAGRPRSAYLSGQG